MEQLSFSELKVGDDVHVKPLDMKGYFIERHMGRYGPRLGIMLSFQKDAKWEEETRWFFPSEIDTSYYPIYRDVENKHGFKDCLDINCDHPYIPLCPTCHCCVMPNRGQGMICDTCDHEFTLHCQHDYDEGMLY